MASYCTGKKPAVHRPKDFLFSAYRETAPAITVPPAFGHSNAFVDWGILGNDAYGDCVWAGGEHETMLLNWLAAGAQQGQPSPVEFSDDTALSDYGSTGFVRNNPATDQGTDVGQALEYRRKIGLIDTSGKRHTIAAYVKLEPKNLQNLYEAAYVFEAVGIGFEFPTTAMDQFNGGNPWAVVPGATIDGGHYVPLIGRAAPGFIDCVTWGRKQTMTEEFYSTYCDEAYGILSLEGLIARTQTNFAGFNWQQLAQDAGVVGVISNDPGSGPSPIPPPLPSLITLTPEQQIPPPLPSLITLTPEQQIFNWGFDIGFNVGWKATHG